MGALWFQNSLGVHVSLSSYQGFGIIAKSVMRDPTLIAGAKALYVYICSYVGAGTTAWTGRETICHDLDIEAHTYTRYLAALRAHDYVRVEQVQGKGGRFGHNVYEIVMKPCPQLPCPEKPDTAEPYAQKLHTAEPCEHLPHAEKLHTNSNITNNIVVVDPPTPLNTATPEQTAGGNPVAQPRPAQSVDEPIRQARGTAGAGQEPEQSGLERKNQGDPGVAEIHAAIRTATGADVPPGDIYALLADHSPEAIMDKVQLMGQMGKQELRNVPGLLRYLLAEDCQHIPGRARGKTRAAPTGGSVKSASEGQPRSKRKRQTELNPHDYLDPEQAAKLEALRAAEAKRAAEKELAEREGEEKRREFLKTLYVT